MTQQCYFVLNVPKLSSGGKNRHVTVHSVVGATNRGLVVILKAFTKELIVVAENLEV